MNRPGFCKLLAFGSALCFLGIICGTLITVAGVLNFDHDQEIAIGLIIGGIACIFQSMVVLGILRSLLWIVDRLLETQTFSQRPDPGFEFPMDERDGLRDGRAFNSR